MYTLDGTAIDKNVVLSQQFGAGFAPRPSSTHRPKEANQRKQKGKQKKENVMLQIGLPERLCRFTECETSRKANASKQKNKGHHAKEVSRTFERHF